ncbi:MAG: metalloregulator ArsR/SmtB family transcription factor [Balneolales bacterium]
MTTLEINSPQIKEVDLDDPATKRPAQLTKALGHPVRLAILKLLTQRDTCFCGDFTDVLPLAQSTVSQHLKVLKDTGLITATSSGVRTCYCLSQDGIDELSECLKSLSSMFDTGNRPDCC